MVDEEGKEKWKVGNDVGKEGEGRVGGRVVIFEGRAGLLAQKGSFWGSHFRGGTPI